MNNLGYNGENGKDILMRDTFTTEGYLKDGKGRARSFLEDAEKEFTTVLDAEAVMKSTILDQCLDATSFWLHTAGRSEGETVRQEIFQNRKRFGDTDGTGSVCRI